MKFSDLYRNSKNSSPFLSNKMLNSATRLFHSFFSMFMGKLNNSKRLLSRKCDSLLCESRKKSSVRSTCIMNLLLAGFLSCYAGRSAFSIETLEKKNRKNLHAHIRKRASVVVIINAKWKRQKKSLLLRFSSFVPFLRGEIKWLNMLFFLFIILHTRIRLQSPYMDSRTRENNIAMLKMRQ